LAEVLQEGAKEAKSTPFQFELGHPVAANDNEVNASLLWTPMVFEAKLPAVQSPVTKQAHPAVLIPNQPEQAEATKLPSQDVCDAASVDPIQTSAVQALGVDRQTHEQPAGLVHDSAAPLAAEANQETIEAASERSADGPPDETIEGSLTSAYPVDTDANPVAAPSPTRGAHTGRAREAQWSERADCRSDYSGSQVPMHRAGTLSLVCPAGQ
jgi:hypothetical protein